MRYLFINSVAGYGSTGKIVEKAARDLMAEGHKCAIAYGRHLVGCEGIELYKIDSKLEVAMHGLKTRLFDGEGFGSKEATKRLVKWIDGFQPDVIWLHNLHGYYLSVDILFKYLKENPQIQVKWTLHDCWSMTGHCSHFMTIGCEQWKTGCQNCKLTKDYPKCIGISDVNKNYLRKKSAFTGLSNCEIIVPCKWLESVVKESYLSGYKTMVCYNKIDTNVFKPTESVFREKYIGDKKMVLGVANVWSQKKGLDDFIRLSQLLDHNKYKIVLVGLTDKQLEQIPSSIIGIKRTSSATELAEIYSAADVYLNLTHEDNYPTTNLEAQACGTPCITYRTGGSPESVPEENVVEVGDLKAIVRMVENLP